MIPDFINEKKHVILVRHLVGLSYLWCEVFLREQEKIFCIYSGPKWLIGRILETEVYIQSAPNNSNET